MKWIVVLLILGGAGFAFWKFQDEIFDAIEGNGSGGGGLFGDGDGGDNGSDGNNGGGNTGSGGTGNGGSGNSGGNNDPDPFVLQYPMPDFRPLDELVGNWQAVPPTAFPREVTLKSDVMFELASGAGSTKSAAGKKALALSLASGQLVLAPRVGSTLRGRTPLDQTDFKEVMGNAYEAYKQRKTQDVLKQRERARNLAAVAPAGSKNIASAAADVVPPENMLKEYEARIGRIPKRDEDGRIDTMIASINAGEVTEIKLDEIKHWGPIRYEVVEDQPYWTATVNYLTRSLFGTFPTEAMALMRHGKVEAWIYTGSMEVVP